MSLARLLAIVLLALAAAAAAAAAQAPADPFPTQLIRVYKADDVRTRITYGDLWMSASKARFDNLRGVMDMRYTETLPPSADALLSGARIYQVLNFAQYFNINRRKLGLCTLPVKWLAMRDLGNLQLRITLLVIDSYHAPTAGQPASCATETYRAPAP